MTNYSVGHAAEQHAAAYLTQHGFKILDLNWRTRYCEIDIIASKNNVMYFFEVKYRKTEAQGTGLDYVTPRKQRQMAFAAELWVNEHAWEHEYRLAAIEIGGDEFAVQSCILDINE